MNSGEAQFVIDWIGQCWPDQPLSAAALVDFHNVLKNKTTKTALATLEQMRSKTSRPTAGALAAAMHAIDPTVEPPTARQPIRQGDPTDDGTDWAAIAKRGVAECKAVMARVRAGG